MHASWNVTQRIDQIRVDARNGLNGGSYSVRLSALAIKPGGEPVFLGCLERWALGNPSSRHAITLNFPAIDVESVILRLSYIGGSLSVASLIVHEASIRGVSLDPVSEPPANFAAVAGPGEGRVGLSWEPPDNQSDLFPVTEYVVMRDEQPLVHLPENVRSYTDSAEPGAWHSYRVRASNEWGAGPPTAAVTVQIPQLSSAPRSFQATPGPDVGEVTLTWEAPPSIGTGALQGYQVHSGPNAENLTWPGHLTAELSQVVTGLGPGEGRFFGVAAVTTVGHGHPPVPVFASAFDAPAQPEGVRATAGATSFDIRVSWQPPEWTGGTPLTRYHVYRAFSNAPPQWIASVQNSTEFMDTSPSTSRPNIYEVRAENLVGLGAASLTACAVPQTSLATCEFVRVFGSTGDAPTAWAHNVVGFTTHDNAGPGNGGPADGDLGRFVEVGDAIEFRIDMGDLANARFIDETRSYGLRIWGRIAAWKANAAPLPEKMAYARVRVNNVDVGILEASQPEAFGREWALTLARDIAVPSSVVTRGLNLVEIVPLDAATTSRHSVEFGWDVWIDAAMIELVAPPVVIVHGWEPDSTWEPPVAVHGWMAELRGSMIVEAESRFHQNPWAWAEQGDSDENAAFRLLAYDSKEDLRRSAGDLAIAVSQLKASAHYSGRVDIVTYSLGGLVSRWYIEQGVVERSGGAVFVPRLFKGNTEVGTLITVGTPHLGSFQAPVYTWETERRTRGFYEGSDGERLCSKWISCTMREWRDWSKLGAWRGNDRQDVVSDFELYPQDENPILRTLNEHVPPTAWSGHADVDYFAIAGRWTDEDNPLGANDGVVGLASATLGGRLRWLEIVDSPLPGGQPLHVRLPSHPELPERVVALLVAPPFVSEGGSVAPPRVTSERAPYVHVTQPRELALGPGRIETFYEIDRVGTVVFYVFSPGGFALDELLVLTPSGSILGLDLVDSGIHYQHHPHAFAIGEIHQIRVTDPAPGIWGLALPTSTGEGLTWMEFSSSIHTRMMPMKLRSEPGEPTKLSMLILDERETLIDVSAVATIRDPLFNTTRTLALSDMGDGSDEVAGDGIFSADYLSHTPGLHFGEVVVTGMAHDTHFARVVPFTVWVHESGVGQCLALDPASVEDVTCIVDRARSAWDG